MKIFKALSAILGLAIFQSATGDTVLTHTFEDGSPALASAVNQNFDDVVTALNNFTPNDSPQCNALSEITYWAGTQWICGERPLGLGVGISPVFEDIYTGNITVGSDTMSAATTGMRSYNILLGAEVAQSFSAGLSNIGIGYSVLSSLDSASDNIAIGKDSLDSAGGSYNVAIGTEALVNVGRPDPEAQDYSITSQSNTAVGYRTGSSLYAGEEITLLGYFANAGSGPATYDEEPLSNATAIGANAWVNASNKIQLGNTAVTAVATSGKLTTGDVTYPNTHGTDGQVLGTSGSGELVWLNSSQIVASYTQELEGQVASLQDQLQSQQEELQSQQEELLALVQSQQEHIAQLQRMIEHQFAVN